MTVLVKLTALLADRPLCVVCLGIETGIDSDVIEAALSALGYLVVVIGACRTCWVCAAVTQTFMVPTRYRE